MMTGSSMFGRRGSNAATSSQMARSSSSSTPGLPPSQYHSVLSPGVPMSNMSSSLGGSTGGRQVGAASPGLNGLNGPTASSITGDMSEFGVGNSFTSTSVGRVYEASSANTSPSQSPSVGVGSSAFSPGSNILSRSAAALPGSHLEGSHANSNTASSASSVISGHQSEKSLREIFARRVSCLSYIKRCLSIASHPSPSQAHSLSITPAWLDVIKLTKKDLEAIYDTDKMKKRTSRNYALGFSIAPFLEYNSSAECARSILMVFQEVETAGEGGDRDKAKMKNFFKTSLRGTRRGTIGADWETGLGGSSNHTSSAYGLELLTGHVPFPLDFFQTTITLFDVLIEMYHKFTWFSLQSKDPANSSSISLNKDNEAGTDTMASFLSATTLETINKIDVKVKKLLSQTCKELDTLARHVIREELAAIDPMMARELGILEGNGSADASFTHLSES